MSKVNFIVVERSFIVRKGLVSLINEMPNTNVVRELELSLRLGDLITHHSADVVVINFDLLNEISSEELRKIAERKKKCFVIAVSTSMVLLADSLKAIVTDTISLDEPKQSVLKKLKSVICRVASLEENPAEGAELSEREIEILKDVALGLSNKEIAEKNFISPHTVITHRKNITRKLGIKTVSGLTIYAILNKLIGMEALK